MTYKKFYTLLFIVNFLFSGNILAQNRDLDTLYKVKLTPFLRQIIDLKDLDAIINISIDNQIIPTQGTIFTPNAQEIIKENNHFYLMIQQTGFVFELSDYHDSVAVFRRLDRTVNINYNIGSLNFLYQNQLYSYGGYGFWRANGHLRKFNYTDMEWDIIPMNVEIITFGMHWLSKKEGKIYVPFQKTMNAGLIEENEFDKERANESFYLDLNLKKWIKLGTMHSETVKLVNQGGAANFLPVTNGIMHVVDDQVIYFDFVHNKIYKCIKADFNQTFVRKIAMTNCFEYKGFIYIFNSANQSFSKVVFDIQNFEELKFPIWGRDKAYDKFIIWAIILILMIIATTTFFNRRFKNKVQKNQLKILKTKSISQAFIGVEASLLKLLLQAADQNIKVEIHQINHVLGIKDKNVGLQKKVRSDVINTINEKYQLLNNSPHPLILSVRKEDDKRFLEYFIAPSEIKNIQKIIDKS
jgi:hypothetical protein